MNEKKFSKKLNDMTPEEKQRKDALWEKISLESGIEVGAKKVFSLRLATTVAMCVLVLCIAIPLVVVNLNKPMHQAGGSVTTSQGENSFTSILPDDDPNKFKDYEYTYIESTETIEEIAKNDSNVLFVKDWKREGKPTVLMKEVAGEKRIIGVVDKSIGKIENQEYEINVNILYADISLERIDKEIEDMITPDDKTGISWRTKDSDGCASFKYNKYTYYIEVKGGGGQMALNAAKALLTSK